jgi:hypothetical protein
MIAEPTPLAAALDERIKVYCEALEDLRGDPMCEQYCELREAIELIRILRRIVQGMNQGEIYRAFGAPGGFGYETLIGDTLAKIYGVRC